MLWAILEEFAQHVWLMLWNHQDPNLKEWHVVTRSDTNSKRGLTRFDGLTKLGSLHRDRRSREARGMIRPSSPWGQKPRVSNDVQCKHTERTLRDTETWPKAENGRNEMVEAPTKWRDPVQCRDIIDLQYCCNAIHFIIFLCIFHLISCTICIYAWIDSTCRKKRNSRPDEVWSAAKRTERPVASVWKNSTASIHRNPWNFGFLAGYLPIPMNQIPINAFFWCQDYFKVDLQWLWLFTKFTIWSVFKKPRVVGYIFFETNSWGSRVHGVHLTVGYVAFFHILPLFDAARSVIPIDWVFESGDPCWGNSSHFIVEFFFPAGKRWNLLKSIESPVSLCSAEAIQQPKVALPMRIRWSGGSRFGSQDISGIFRWCQMMSDVTVEFCSRCVLWLCYARGMAPAANPWSTRGHFPDLGTARAWDSECTAKIRKTHRDGRWQKQM